MRVRLVHITLRRSGAKAKREEILEVDRMTVGRGADNSLLVPDLVVPLHHSTFTESVDGVYLEAADREVRVNGEPTKSQRLKEGDVVRAGTFEIRVIPKNENESLAVEVEQIDVPAKSLDQLRARMSIEPEQGFLTRRTLSWTLALLLPFLFMTLPIAYRLFAAPPPSTGSDRPPDRSMFARAAHWVEGSWISGPLASNHVHLADDCAACHISAFEPVQDEACTNCHAAVGRHTTMEINSEAANAARCASCHLEHNGEGLAEFGAPACTSCHSDLKDWFAETTLFDVESFSNEHPEFRPAIVADPGAKQRARTPMELIANPPEGEDPVREQSGLKFNHVVHLAPITGGDGEEVTLVCADCHSPDASRELIKPIDYEPHCESCHDLSFEKDRAPAPHEDVPRVRQAVLDTYSAIALEGQAPGGGRKKDKPIPTDREGALGWAREKAEAANQRLLSSSGTCALCHTMNDAEGTITVTPVLLPPEPGAERWWTMSDFDHGPHEVMQCKGCHDMSKAEDSGAIALPGIAICRDCHGDTQTEGELESTCTTCHDFHHIEHGVMESIRLRRERPAEVPAEDAAPAEAAPPEEEKAAPVPEAPAPPTDEAPVVDEPLPPA